MTKSNNFPRLVVSTWTTALAATAPPLWLFSRLQSYQFLFSAPSDLGKFATLINVFAFTGYLLAQGLVPLCCLLVLVSSAKSFAANLFFTTWGLCAGFFIFTRGILFVGHPDLAAHAIGTILLVAIIVRWVPVLQRYGRSHAFAFLIVVYAVAIGIVILVAFWNTQPVWMPVREHGQLLAYVPIPGDPYTFYEGKALSAFQFWDWTAALAGGAVYLATAYYWRRVDSSSEIEEAVPPETA